MKNTQKFLLVMFTVVFVILLNACENSSEESKVNNQTQNNAAPQSSNSESSNADVSEDVSNTDNTNTDSLDTGDHDTNEKKEISNKVPVRKEVSSTNNTTSGLKEEYLNKINDTKKEVDEMEATDSSTYALKKLENDRWDAWDDLLNEMYGILEEQLSAEKMDQLRKKQRNWIKYRDDSALEASEKYKGGTQERVEYVAVLANLTEERCYELVETFMN
ncbi:lysozyme inhibitor LprI family protein [Virgibacillus sp. W0181]|uniref:lysozyme inhibitor LprI family protein n=1 Tax=Virgibacillus sp. W0181 TaxID=3391581 RepID=UPI003F46F5FF